MAFGDDKHHPDSHIEHLIHLIHRNIAAALDDSKDWRNTPRRGLDQGITGCRENAREVINETASGDMSGALEPAVWNRCKQRLIIPVNAKQLFAKRPCHAVDFLKEAQSHLFQ